MNKDQLNFHKSRRIEFSKLIGNDAIALIFGNTHRNKSYDGDYKFKQYKNFYYLTGFTEANTALVIAPGGLPIEADKKKLTAKEMLFVQQKDERLETWNGKRLGYKNVKKSLGIEHSDININLGKILNSRYLGKYRKFYVNFAELMKLTGEMKKIVSDFMESLNIIAPNVEIIDVSYILGKMRSIKSEFEIERIRDASHVSVGSYNEILEILEPGMNEFEVQSTLEYYYRYHGGDDIAYHPIVAAGENACILHYENNDQTLKKDQLLLIDSASEFNYYCSDITRTFPVSGKFTDEQKQIYEIVLKANKDCIKNIKPGVKFSKIAEMSDKILAEGLHKAGLLKDKSKIKKYSLHGIGHHIGLDTHDAVPSSLTKTSDTDTLKPGMVLTIEPGIYFTNDMKEIPAKYRGMGIRIEDVILVTAKGCDNLTEAMVKEVKDVEERMTS
ncbi:MAG TPA: aminopeptidase P family protein [Ignavibacteria bacterium]|nr:aminopeptidase P family protein [Ignavibacteria bacterium]HQY51699.1 aminopeptidase P family protein [Ignavibacteria bacterium]HRA99504.1 aminopeptidase P family protein [Ignavibacteria bacterium]